MKDKNFDNMMRQAYGWLKKQQKKKSLEEKVNRSGCLSEESICDYLGSHLSASDKEKVEEHLSYCQACRQLLTTVVELEQAEKIESTSQIKSEIDQVKKNLQLSLVWVKGYLKLKKTNLEYFPFWNNLQPILVRGRDQKCKSNIPSFSQIIPGYKVIIQVRGEEKGQCEVHCQLLSLAKQSLGSKKIRVELLQAKRTIYSYPLENDTTQFSGIEPGEYEIKIREGENQLALLSLDIVNEE